MVAAQPLIADEPTVVRLDGELDGHTAAAVRTALHGVANGGPVLIDVAAVTFIDSAGLGALIGGIRQVRVSGGWAEVSGARPSIRRLLETTGVDRLAPLADLRGPIA